jgi:hypothetical protein
MDAGNCGELSSALARSVLDKGGYAEVWMLGGDEHAFTVIGKPPTMSTYVKNMSDWKNVWIGDPWANIFVEAPEYATRFKEQMTKWTADKKYIVDHLGAFEPTKWLDLPNKGMLRLEAPRPENPDPWDFQTYHAR